MYGIEKNLIFKLFILRRTILKGIILAGGTGTRLYPITNVVSKQLLPIYDKPTIYYPLSVHMLAGLKEILIISTPRDLPLYKELLGDGSQWGISLSYAEQPYPEGLAQAFIIAREFVGNDSVSLILGDNLFYGDGLRLKLKQAVNNNDGATIFAYQVNNPERYGVVYFDNNDNPIDIVEKPEKQKSKSPAFAVTGLYFYDNQVLDMAQTLKPSARGELEITDINRIYLKKKNLRVVSLGRGFAWLDIGTHATLMQASNFIEAIESRQGLKVACLEEIAYIMGYIDENQLERLAEPLMKSDYGAYLMELVHAKREQD